MVVVMLSWIYILFICVTAGSVVMALLERLFPLQAQHSLTGLATAGMAAVTVYAEYYSLLGGVGIICHFIMLAVLFICVWRIARVREILTQQSRRLREALRGNTGLFLLAAVVIVAFFTSRGTFHTDTGIYHAAAIRWIEEYGVVKGQANIDLHYGYNSAYLLFCSLFTFSWLPGIGATAAGDGTLALHTTTGFLAALYGCYACYHLRDFMSHHRHLADAARVALLVYILTNATGFMSPATDYGTLLVCSYLICAWLDVYENEMGRTKQEQIYTYGLLSMLALFATSMKLSSAGLFLLVLLPLAVLIRQRKWLSILQFMLMGILLFLPFVIRNVILSGWLFYPFEAIDLYDVSKVNLSIPEWFSAWWEGQPDYGQHLLYCVACSPLLFLVNGILSRGREEKDRIGAGVYMMIAALYVSCVLWFLTAPFIRYGLSFLLALVFLPLFSFCGKVFKPNRYGICKIPGVFLSAAIVLFVGFWLSHYAEDDLVFVKHHLTDAYYLTQQPFDEVEEEAVTITNDDGSASLTVYAAGLNEINSYYRFPGTCYSFMSERSKMLGDSIEEGFAAQ